MATIEQSPCKLHSSRINLSRDASILTPAISNKKVKINVGGQIHEPFASTLKNIPDSPLAWILQDKCKNVLDYDKESGELFFDRHPEIFSQVLDYFQTGKLHHPRSVCGPMFEEELKFWGIEEQQMETCCWHMYTHHRVTQDHLKIFTSQEGEPVAEVNDAELGQANKLNDSKDISQWKACRHRVWQLLDQPSSSTAAKLYAWLSLVFVVLSVVTFTMYTMKKTNIKSGTINQPRNNNTFVNQTEANKTANHVTNSSSSSSDLWLLFLPAEGICVVWFTLEFVIKIIFCPNKFQFFTSLSTFLDAVALITSYLLLFMPGTDPDVIGILNIARYFRITKFFRIFYSLQVLGRTLRASAYHFLTLLFLLIIPVMVFSSVIYYIEKNWGKAKSKVTMENIPKTLWWAIITMTTVGYGDAVPESIPGYFVGGAAAIMGVIILSLTGSILGSTFEQYYNLAQTQLKIPKNRHNKIQVHFESLHEMAGMPTHEISKSSIKSCNTNFSGRDSGYGNSPVSKLRGRSVSHPPAKKNMVRPQRRGSLHIEMK